MKVIMLIALMCLPFSLSSANMNLPLGGTPAPQHCELSLEGEHQGSFIIKGSRYESTNLQGESCNWNFDITEETDDLLEIEGFDAEAGFNGPQSQFTMSLIDGQSSITFVDGSFCGFSDTLTYQIVCYK